MGNIMTAAMEYRLAQRGNRLSGKVVSLLMNEGVLIAVDAKRVHVWRRSDGTKREELKASGVSAAALKGSLLAIAKNGEIRVIDLRTGKVLQSLMGKICRVLDLDIGDEKSWPGIIVSGDDAGCVNVWSLGKCKATLNDRNGTITSVAAVGADTVASCATSGRLGSVTIVTIWLVSTRTRLREISGIGQAAAFFGHQFVKSTTSGVEVVDARNGNVTSRAHVGGSSRAMSMNDTIIASCRNDGMLSIFAKLRGRRMAWTKSSFASKDSPIATHGMVVAVVSSSGKSIKLLSGNSGVAAGKFCGSELVRGSVGARNDFGNLLEQPVVLAGILSPRSVQCRRVAIQAENSLNDEEPELEVEEEGEIDAPEPKCEHGNALETFNCCTKLQEDAQDLAPAENANLALELPPWNEDAKLLDEWIVSIDQDPILMIRAELPVSISAASSNVTRLEKRYAALQQKLRVESRHAGGTIAKRDNCKVELLEAMRAFVREPVDEVCQGVEAKCEFWRHMVGDGPILANDVRFSALQAQVKESIWSIRRWELKDTPATVAERTRGARQVVDAKIQTLVAEGKTSLMDPSFMDNISKDLEDLHEALYQQVSFLRRFDPGDGRPDALVADAMTMLRSFISGPWARATRSVVAELTGVQEKLSTLASCESPPDATACRDLVLEMLDLADEISDGKRDEGKLERQKLRGIDVKCVDRKLAEVRTKLRQLDERRRDLDRKLTSSRAALLKAAEDHYPELLHDNTWLGQVGLGERTAASLPELQLGLFLENFSAQDFTLLSEVNSSVGKVVQHVRDEHGRDLALKRFSLSSHLAARQFMRQVRLVQELTSPNVVSFHGAFVETSNAFLIMPWFSQGDLAMWLDHHREGTSKQLETCKQIARGICAGLHCIHSNGHVHCDLKPSNIFLTPNLHPVIGDFDGLRESDQAMTRGMQVTFEFLPPEVRDGHAQGVDASIDMFAFGVILEKIFDGLACNAACELARLCKSPDPKKRPTAARLLENPFLAASRAELRECFVCCAHHVEDRVVSCAANHFLCEDCFRRSISSFARGDTESQVQVAESGAVKCLCATCPETIPAKDAAQHADDATWQIVLGRVRDRFKQELDKEHQVRLAEARRVGLQDNLVQHHRDRVIEDILNLQCPRCRTVFFDFRGCCALSCANPTCECQFCAWCFRDCGNNGNTCHRHVRNCPMNTHKHIDPLFGDMNKLLEAMQKRRASKIDQYWRSELSKASPSVRQGVHDAIAPLLHGLVPHDYQLANA
ncbi:Probable serine/threonine-protein kinase DDB_G0275165 [Durusdinium trenchii]|uniref:Probable serine/threonine-protein kinase DDB_G0275165 n=1 Tax=Durusdinium trenchii TaxID=1381693 RepID=A0ABP0IA70_9DINO